MSERRRGRQFWGGGATASCSLCGLLHAGMATPIPGRGEPGACQSQGLGEDRKRAAIRKPVLEHRVAWTAWPVALTSNTFSWNPRAKIGSRGSIARQIEGRERVSALAERGNNVRGNRTQMRKRQILMKKMQHMLILMFN